MTHTKLYIQIILATKKGIQIPTDHADEIYHFICHKINKSGQAAIAINGMQDHIHLLIAFNPGTNLCKLMNDVKRSTTAFINRKKWLTEKFGWQKGFGAFSYSKSHLETVIRYIEKQEQVHEKWTFEEEYIAFLKRFEVDFNRKNIFKFQHRAVA